MKKLILIIAILFAPSISAQDIDLLLNKYANYITVTEKSVEYVTKIEYQDGRKTDATFLNAITSYDVSVPELGIDYKAPPIEGIRLIDGVIWVGSKKSNCKNVKTFEVISETWFDEYDTPTAPSDPNKKLFEFINHPSVNESELDAISWVRRISAENIIENRPITNITELDDITWVGNNTIESLRAYAETWVNPDVEEPPVLDPCQTSIITEWNIDDVWYYGQPKVEVNAGSYFVISGLPNTTDFTIIKPDGTIVDDDYKINSISKNDAGVYIIRSNGGCEKPLEVIVN